MIENSSVRGCLNSDKESIELSAAIAEFVITEGRRLKAHIAYIVGNDLAEDIYQQSITQVFEAKPFKALADGGIGRYIWLSALRLAHSAKADRCREQSITTEISERELPSAPHSLDSETDTQQKLSLISEAVAKLPEPKRQVFVMRAVLNMRVKDIAIALGISYTNTRYHISEATNQVSEYVIKTDEGSNCHDYKKLLLKSAFCNIPLRQKTKLTKHLTHCWSCRALRTELIGQKHQLGALLPAALLFTAGGSGLSWLSDICLKLIGVVRDIGGRSIELGSSGQVYAAPAAKVAVVAVSSVVAVGGGYEAVKSVNNVQTPSPPVRISAGNVSQSPAAKVASIVSEPPIKPKKNGKQGRQKPKERLSTGEIKQSVNRRADRIGWKRKQGLIKHNIPVATNADVSPGDQEFDKSAKELGN